jgi:ankyrin repeat protein
LNSRTLTEQTERLQRSQTKKVFSAVRKSTATLSYEDKDIEDAASILTETPSVSFEMDKILMQHRRYQETYPGLYDRMRENFPSRRASSLISPSKARHVRQKSINNDPIISNIPSLPFLGIPFQGENIPTDSDSESENSVKETPSNFDGQLNKENGIISGTSVTKPTNSEYRVPIGDQAIQSVHNDASEGDIQPDDHSKTSLQFNTVMTIASVPKDVVVIANEPSPATSLKEIQNEPDDEAAKVNEKLPEGNTLQTELQFPNTDTKSDSHSLKSWHGSDISDLYDASDGEESKIFKEERNTRHPSNSKTENVITEPSIARDHSTNIITTPFTHRKDSLAQVKTLGEPVFKNTAETKSKEQIPTDQLQINTEVPSTFFEINFGPDIDLEITATSPRSEMVEPHTNILKEVKNKNTISNGNIPRIDVEPAVEDSNLSDPFRDSIKPIKNPIYDQTIKSPKMISSETTSSTSINKQDLQGGQAKSTHELKAPEQETEILSLHSSTDNSSSLSLEDIPPPLPPRQAKEDESNPPPLPQRIPPLPPPARKSIQQSSPSPSRKPPPIPTNPTVMVEDSLLPETKVLLHLKEIDSQNGLLRGKSQRQTIKPKVSFDEIFGNPASPQSIASPSVSSETFESVRASGESVNSSQDQGTKATTIGFHPNERYSTSQPRSKFLIPEEVSTQETRRIAIKNSLSVHRIDHKGDKSKNPLKRLSSMMGLKGFNENKIKLDHIAEAAETGDSNGLTALLSTMDKAADAQALHALGTEQIPRTALMRAAAGGHISCMKLLVKYEPPNGYLVDKRGKTALHYALESNQSEAAQWLVIPNNSGVDVTNLDQMLDKDGLAPIHLAAMADGVETLKSMVELEVNLNVRSNRNETALHFAISKQRLMNVEYLLHRGVNVNAINTDFETPLMVASRLNALSAAQLLLKQGADKTMQDKSGNYAIHHAACNGNLQIVETLFLTVEDLLVKNNMGEQPLHVAAANNQLKVVKALVNIPGVQINAWTEPSRVKTFKPGDRSNMNVVDNMSKLACTPLHYACSKGNYDIASTLIEHGAMVNANQEDGTSPLMMACDVQSFGLVQLLLTQGANPNAATAKEGITALHISCKRDDFETTRILVLNGADISLKLNNKYKDTPSMLAYRENSPTQRKAASWVATYRLQAIRGMARVASTTTSSSNTNLANARTMINTNPNAEAVNNVSVRELGSTLQGYFTPSKQPPTYTESQEQQAQQNK